MPTNYILYEILGRKRNGELNLKCLGELLDEVSPVEGKEVWLTSRSDIVHWKIDEVRRYRVERVIDRYTQTERVHHNIELTRDSSLVYLKPIKCKSRRSKK